MNNHLYLHVKHIYFKLILIHENLGYHYQMVLVCKEEEIKTFFFFNENSSDFIIVNAQIFHDSVKNVYRILSVDGSKVLINTIVTARMSFTKTSQKFCQWVDSRANHVYGLGFASEIDLTRVKYIQFNWVLVFIEYYLVYG